MIRTECVAEAVNVPLITLQPEDPVSDSPTEDVPPGTLAWKTWSQEGAGKLLGNWSASGGKLRVLSQEHVMLI